MGVGQENVAVIVQARMNSSRMPGKVLMPICGKPVLWHVVERARRISGAGKVVVATSVEMTDDPVAEWCSMHDVEVYRGPLDDVLRRYVDCADQMESEIVVRITGDCPIIDPEVSAEVLRTFSEAQSDYCTLAQGYPDGLDTQVFRVSALQSAHQYADSAEEREHIGLFIERNPSMFSTSEAKIFFGLDQHRWTLDYPRDYEFLQRIFGLLFDEDPFFSSRKVLECLKDNPDLMAFSKESQSERSQRG